jgi:PAS domain S-box-containing protein
MYSQPFPIQQERRILEVLSSLSYQTGKLDHYLQEIAHAVSELINLDWSTVTLCRNGFERVLASSIEIGTAMEQQYELHGTLTGTVVEQGCSVVVEDATTATVYGKPPEGYQSYLGVPLRMPSGEVMGTICSFHQQPRHFTAEEIRLVEIFAERAATAIDNYQMYQKLQEFNESLEAEVMKRTLELRSTQAQLMEVNRTLEQRVADRTAELQTTNQQLYAEIKERKQTEAKLRQSEEQLRQIAENMNQVLWMYSQDGTPIYVNAAFETVWQLPRQDWHHQAHCWDSLHPEDRSRIEVAFAQAGEHGFQEEYRIIRPDGTIREIRDQAFPIQDETGQIYRIAGIAEDITERKQAEREKLKAIASLAEVGELAAMIVHEIRNPLTTVWMGLNAFKRMDLSDSIRERLTLAIDEAERLRNLLNEILLYAKPQTLHCVELELNHWATELLTTLHTLPAVQNRSIELIASPVPVRVMVDSDKLKQVVINLINNACEAVMPNEVIRWQIEPEPQMVNIQIHNGGDPIPPERLSDLTKPFYTTKASGTGLGLAIVKRIVEAHRGELRITSSAASGTTVTVQLPSIPG